MIPLLVPLVQTAPSLDPNHSAGAWPPSAVISLSRNVAHVQAAIDSTTVHVATDGKFLYVRFDAVQREPITANQHSDDVITGGANINGGIAWSDDAVWVESQSG